MCSSIRGKVRAMLDPYGWPQIDQIISGLSDDTRERRARGKAPRSAGFKTEKNFGGKADGA